MRKVVYAANMICRKGADNGMAHLVTFIHAERVKQVISTIIRKISYAQLWIVITVGWFFTHSVHVFRPLSFFRSCYIHA
jgi:hypothetical protein